MKTTILSYTIALLLVCGLPTNFQQSKVLAEKSAQSYTKVLLFTWQESVTDQEKEMVHSIFKTLHQEIKGFISFEMNLVISGDYDSVILLEFANMEAEQAYLQHEQHQRLVEKGPEIIGGFMEYKYQNKAVQPGD